MTRPTRLLIAAIAIWATGLAAGPARAGVRPGPALRNAVEFSPLSPVIDIWALQYARSVGNRGELLLGASYANIGYDSGRSHAPGVILGYRQYVWKKAHVEYQLWPSYNWFDSTVEHRTFEGGEIWNEFRPGWTFDFDVAGKPCLLNLQYLVGFALHGGNKPESFRREVDDEPIFTTPMFFVGWRF